MKGIGEIIISFTIRRFGFCERIEIVSSIKIPVIMVTFACKMFADVNGTKDSTSTYYLITSFTITI